MSDLIERIAKLEAAAVHWKVAESIWDKDAVERLEAKVAKLEAALNKIRSTPGNARDCRYIAAEALKNTEVSG